jgi:hypothetical protein
MADPVKSVQYRFDSHSGFLMLPSEGTGPIVYSYKIDLRTGNYPYDNGQMGLVKLFEAKTI